MFTLPTGGDLLNRCLRHGYPAALEVLAQALVQLGKAAQLQFGHALLLALSVAASADFVGCGGHHDGRGAAAGRERLRMAKERRRAVGWGGLWVERRALGCVECSRDGATFLRCGRGRAREGRESGEAGKERRGVRASLTCGPATVTDTFSDGGCGGQS